MVLNKDEFFTRLNAAVGTDTSDASLAFIEDMTDTYNHLEQQANGDDEDWEKKYHELDESWKQKYRHRFFSGGGNSNSPNGYSDNDEDAIIVTPDNITVDNLFK